MASAFDGASQNVLRMRAQAAYLLLSVAFGRPA
jgi:hypothetical protein